MIVLRSATEKDAIFLFKLRNDEKTEAASHNTGDISWSEHLVWLKNTFKNKNRKLYIAEEDFIPVGQIRTDFSCGVYELSWTVEPELRNKGIGKRMVAELAKKISGKMRAEIKSDNISSIRIAEYIGMRKYCENNRVLYYKTE